MLSSSLQRGFRKYHNGNLHQELDLTLNGTKLTQYLQIII